MQISVVMLIFKYFFGPNFGGGGGTAPLPSCRRKPALYVMISNVIPYLICMLLRSIHKQTSLHCLSIVMRVICYNQNEISSIMLRGKFLYSQHGATEIVLVGFCWFLFPDVLIFFKHIQKHSKYPNDSSKSDINHNLYETQH